MVYPANWAIPIYIRTPPLLRNRKIPSGEGIFFQMENSMEGGIFGLEIPWRGLKYLQNAGNSMGGG